MSALEQPDQNKNRRDGWFSKLLDHDGRVMVAVAVGAFAAVVAILLAVPGTVRIDSVLVAQMVTAILLVVVIERCFQFVSLNHQIRKVDERLERKQEAFTEELERHREALRRSEEPASDRRQDNAV